MIGIQIKNSLLAFKIHTHCSVGGVGRGGFREGQIEREGCGEGIK